MLRFGPDDGPVVVMALPLFEEANRVRAFAVSILRALAEAGVAGGLPDLPGTGESLTPCKTMTMRDLHEGYEGAVAHLLAEHRLVYGASLRSGALLDKLGLVAGHWYLSPQSGPDLLRELTRIKQAQSASGARLGERWYCDPTVTLDMPPPAVEIAGHLVAPDLLSELASCEAFLAEDGLPLRVVRLAADPKHADLKMDGTPLWRRTEPGNNLDFAQALADDIVQWVRACASC